MDSLGSDVFAGCKDVCTLYRVSQNYIIDPSLKSFIKVHMLILQRKKTSMKTFKNL